MKYLLLTLALFLPLIMTGGSEANEPEIYSVFVAIAMPEGYDEITVIIPANGAEKATVSGVYSEADLHNDKFTVTTSADVTVTFEK